MIRKVLFLIPFRTVKYNFGFLYQPKYSFCANKSQSQLLQQVEAKVFEILKSAAKCDQSKLNKTATF